jgi:uncharacterized protein (DUF2252 family)
MTASRSLIKRLVAVDEGRVPALLARKYRRMSEDAFAFFRGSGHLFHADFPGGLKRYPTVWLNGDLHLENFGTYRGENRLTYFDIGDFDEGALGPASRDLLRFLTALHLAAPLLALSAKRAGKLGRIYLAAYRDALSSGKALWLERPLAKGLIGDLMLKLDKRLVEGPDGSAWLRSRITGSPPTGSGKRSAKKAGRDAAPHKDTRRLRLDTGKAMPAPKEARRAIEAAIRHIAWQQRALGHGKWKILDVTWRIAGLGTLGLPRFAILVRVSPNQDGAIALTTERDLLLLDLKLQPGSNLAPHLGKQPRFASQAERVVAIENRLQAISPAFLTAVRIDGQNYTLRELQPEADKLDLRQIMADQGHLDFDDLQQAIDMMGRLTAWAQLRSGGRQGSAEADALIAFGGRSGWVADLLEAAERMAVQGTENWSASRDWLLREADRLAPLAAAEVA